MILCISRYARPASAEELFDGYPLAAEELDDLRLGNNQRKRSEPEHFSRSKIDISSDFKFVFNIKNSLNVVVGLMLISLFFLSESSPGVDQLVWKNCEGVPIPGQPRSFKAR